uniref:Transmembrane protein n=1 Tax=Globodera pallida TaxID=36090 RepID=A0A183CHH1_GLOPA
MQQKHSPKPIQKSIISLFNMSMLTFILITLFFLDICSGVEENGNSSPACPPAPKKPPPPKQKNIVDISQKLIRTLAFDDGSKSVGNASVDSTPPALRSSVCPPAPQQKNNKKKDSKLASCDSNFF